VYPSPPPVHRAFPPGPVVYGTLGVIDDPWQTFVSVYTTGPSWFIGWHVYGGKYVPFAFAVATFCVAVSGHASPVTRNAWTACPEKESFEVSGVVPDPLAMLTNEPLIFIRTSPEGSMPHHTVAVVPER